MLLLLLPHQPAASQQTETGQGQHHGQLTHADLGDMEAIVGLLTDKQHAAQGIGPGASCSSATSPVRRLVAIFWFASWLGIPSLLQP